MIIFSYRVVIGVDPELSGLELSKCGEAGWRVVTTVWTGSKIIWTLVRESTNDSTAKPMYKFGQRDPRT